MPIHPQLVHSVNCVYQTKFYTYFMKTFVHDYLNVTQIMISVSNMVENFVGKEENAGDSIFSFFHNVFKSFSNTFLFASHYNKAYLSAR